MKLSVDSLTTGLQFHGDSKTAAPCPRPWRR
jgi:hypothetical protein